MDEIRIDKYLWTVRIYKTRSLATDECKKGRVLINNCEVKPSRIVKINERIDVKFPPIVRSFIVTGISQNRVSAAVAKTLVEEITPQSEFDRLKMLNNTFEKRDAGAGRPTKKERRQIEKFREL
ncbi:MAG: RNA-binding S4 domain-containing protein [Bacteroidales bacterium]|nr:RNA-binding S4 domain-containing protein [Bacteroidales bacterium]